MTYNFFKRLFDILFSLILLVCFSPILILICFLIKFSSHGPIIYVQDRMGLNRSVFKIYKFRTMYIHDESIYVQTTIDDKRITKIGGILRKTSLDELPQLINVLIGDMSIVGPRPTPIPLAIKYEENFKNYKMKYKVLPGLTGYAQIKNLRGGDDLESIKLRLEYDLKYVDNYNLLLDIIIILKTPFVLWGKKVY